MKTISIMFALVNSLIASLVVASALPSIQILRPASSLWSVTKVAASAAVITAGIFTWIAAGRTTTNPNFILIIGLFLVALGTASAVWTIHLALLSGAVKDHMFIFGGSLMAQGTASIWNLLPAGKSIPGV